MNAMKICDEMLDHIIDDLEEIDGISDIDRRVEHLKQSAVDIYDTAIFISRTYKGDHEMRVKDFSKE